MLYCKGYRQDIRGGITAVAAVVPLYRFSACNGSISGPPLYKDPFFFKKGCPIQFLSPPLLQSSNQLDLSIPPPKLVDLRRIEGEGQDLHLHQPVFHFPLICLRDSCLGFPLGKPRCLVVLTLIVIVSVAVLIWEPQIKLWVCVPRTS